MLDGDDLVVEDAKAGYGLLFLLLVLSALLHWRKL
jgi:hypothetical protein